LTEKAKINNSTERSAEKAGSEENEQAKTIHCPMFRSAAAEEANSQTGRASQGGVSENIFKKLDEKRTEIFFPLPKNVFPSSRKPLLTRSSHSHSNGNIIAICCASTASCVAGG
jgi:hypothetical protein